MAKREVEKCGHCGRFISREDKNVTLHYTPDTEFSSEECYYHHKKCPKPKKARK